MSKLTVLTLLALAVAVPGRAAVAPDISLRLQSVLGAYWQPGDSLPPAPLVHARAVWRAQDNEPLMTRAMWDAAPPVDPAIAKWLAARVPGLDTSKVHEPSYEQVAAVVAECARRGYSNLDLFSDDGLRGDAVFYLSANTMARLYREYELAASLQASGMTNDGKPYHMDGIVMGGGAVNILYNFDNFEFDSGGRTYRAKARIVQSIQGKGTLGVSGLWVKVWPFWPRIEKLTKLGGGKMRVDTDKGSRDMNDDPIRRR
jgi:hypothetical protein